MAARADLRVVGGLEFFRGRFRAAQGRVLRSRAPVRRAGVLPRHAARAGRARAGLVVSILII